MSNEPNNQNKPGLNGPRVEDILYTDKTLAKLLGYSESTIRRYRRARLINYIQPAGKVFYTKAIIEEFLDRFKKLLSLAGLMQFMESEEWFRMMEVF